MSGTAAAPHVVSPQRDLESLEMRARFAARDKGRGGRSEFATADAPDNRVRAERSSVILVRGLRMSYGEVEAVRGIDVDVAGARSSRSLARTGRARRRRSRSWRATGHAAAVMSTCSGSTRPRRRGLAGADRGCVADV